MSPLYVGLMCIWMLLMLRQVIVYDTAGNSGTDEHDSLFSLCDRDGWKFAQLYGPCWNSLFKLPATTTWIDITFFVGYALMLFCSVALVLYRCTKFSKRYPVEGFYQIVTVVITILMILTAIYKDSNFSQLYMTRSRPVQANVITSQLSKSLLQYGHNDNITRAWQNTMREGCCCGLHGYQDFPNVGVDVPLQCGCFEEEEQPYLYKGCTRQYNSDSDKQPACTCTAAPTTNFTHAGCLSFVVDKVDSSTWFAAVAQFVCVVFSAVFILICILFATANMKATDNGDDDSVKGQILQIKHEKNTDYSFKESLLKKLVRITIKTRMI